MVGSWKQAVSPGPEPPARQLSPTIVWAPDKCLVWIMLHRLSVPHTSTAPPNTASSKQSAAMLSTPLKPPRLTATPSKQQHHHKRLAATSAAAQHAAVTTTSRSSSNKAPAADTATAAPADGRTQQQQQQQAPTPAAGIRFSKRQLLTFSCACCLSLQSQQRLPATADSGAFSYSGAEGPSSWGGACSSGTQQSPIDLPLSAAACDSRPPPDFRYQPSSGVSVKNTGTTLQVNFGAAAEGQQQATSSSNSISWAGQQLELLQYHFHTPSEHTVEGARSSMEAHLVHQNKQTGAFTVLAVLLEAPASSNQQQQQPAPNPCLAAGLAAVPATPGASAPVSTPVDPAQLLPTGAALQQYVAYRGSLTTPPCSEGVQWLVWTQPVAVPRAQVDAFREFVHGTNSRPLQPLNSRAVVTSCIAMQ